jgi:hypothetical protein
VERTFASKSLKSVTIFGTRADAAEVMLLESEESNVPAAVVSLVAVVIADFKLPTLTTSPRDWSRLPVYEVASLVRVATSEAMLDMSLRTVLAERLERGRAATVEESRRMRALVNCILIFTSGKEMC